MLATSPDISVVGTARSGREALAAFGDTQPDVICTDYQMPEMDGLSLIQQTMASFPRPILVISSLLDPAHREQIFPLLAAGAVDVIAKPDASSSFEQAAAALTQKIKLLSGVVVISRRLTPLRSMGSSNLEAVAPSFPPAQPKTEREILTSRLQGAPQSFEEARFTSQLKGAEATSVPGGECASTVLRPYQAHPVRLIAIGASTGGPHVLQTLFTRLRPLSCPVLCVQHISTGFLQGLVEWLNDCSSMRVKIAERDEKATAGTVYFPPENSHLEIDEHGYLIHSQRPPLGGHKPAVTVTFESAARHYGRGALGVLLTGMGNDGAAGLEEIMLAGGTTMVQNEASCVVFGMPKQAVMRGAAHFVLSPEQIAEKIERLVPPFSN